jgi:hypothetical protein
LRQSFGAVQLLFYLAVPPPEIDPRCLIPCPARPLAPETFIYEGLNQPEVFRPATAEPYYTPLAATSGMFGYLFLEPPAGQPRSAMSQETLARLASQTARYLNYLSQTGQIPAGKIGRPPPLIIDKSHNWVWIEGKLRRVSPKEATLLRLLYEQPDQLCPREVIQQSLYGDETPIPDLPDDRLDKLIFRFRLKLKRVPGNRVYLQTVRGFGYRLLLNDEG